MTNDSLKNTTVLISGASIAGPALAYWLHHYGATVTVVERAPVMRSGGQAVDFKGATHRTVLERMGILDDVRALQTGGHDQTVIDAGEKPLAVYLSSNSREKEKRPTSSVSARHGWFRGR